MPSTSLGGSAQRATFGSARSYLRWPCRFMVYVGSLVSSSRSRADDTRAEDSYMTLWRLASERA